MNMKDRKLWIALAWRQLFFFAVIAAGAGVHLAINGEWIGWPLIIVAALGMNVMWCVVA